MPHLVDRHGQCFVVNQIDYSVVTLPHAISIIVPSQLLRALGSRIARKTRDLFDNSPPVTLGADLFDLFARGRLEQQPIFRHDV